MKSNQIKRIFCSVPPILLLVILSCKKEEVPVVSTIYVDQLTTFTAKCSGMILDDGGNSITAHGACWSTNEYPIITGDKTSEQHEPVDGAFLSSISGLSANTTYYVRAYATNKMGTGYGEQIQFVTLIDNTGQTGIVNDIDGNTYSTIGIGCQIWMAENLKTTKYNDGTAIPNVTADPSWFALAAGAYCDYDNNIANSYIYGRLYNWYVVASDNTKNVCPEGWHVPDWSELSILPDIPEGYDVAGGKLKETGTTHWISPNTAATNETGYKALPGGLRSYDGTFSDNGNFGYWWSSTDYKRTLGGSSAWSIMISYNSGSVTRGYTNPKQNGFSVRCIKD